MFIKSLRRAVQPRALGGLSRGYKGLSSGVINWTHECSSLADSDLETAKLEKSIQGGCRSILTQSGDSLKEIYEIIQDLHLTDYVKLEHFTLSHRLRHAGKGTVPASVNESSQEADIKAWTDELATIKDHLQPHGLSFVTLPITFFTSIAQLEDPCTSKLEDLITQIRRSHGSGVRIGLDFSSQVLYNADEETTISYLNLIQYLYRMSYNDSGFYFPLECMTVACNAFTYEKASQMMSLGRSITIPVAATEIVRAHPRRIGTITLPHDRFAPSSVDAVDKTAAMAYGSPSQSKQQDDDFDEPLPHDPQDKALVLLNRSLKSCLSMEKQYMSRFDPPPVPITDVCWAHIIISTFQSVAKPIEETNETKTKDDINSNTNRNRNLILFAEEWEYNLRTRINPVFESAMTTLEKNSAETADFRVLYKPLANILFRSYTDALKERKIMMYNEVEEALGQGSPLVGAIPQTLAALALVYEPSTVCLSDTEILEEYWSSQMAPAQWQGMKMSDAHAHWARVRHVLDTFGEP